MILLPNNRLILNGHRIFNKRQFFEYLTKRLKNPINSEEDLKIALSNYQNLAIAIWHADSFLKDESREVYTKIIQLLSDLGNVKQTLKK